MSGWFRRRRFKSPFGPGCYDRCLRFWRSTK